jgi:hypothetical protein
VNGPIADDVAEEAMRLLRTAERAGIPLRVLGGMAIVLHAGDDLHPAFRREIRDIDFVAPKGKGRRVTELLVAEGYEPNRTFNAMHGARRLLFYDEAHARQVDVFVGTFEMCHVLPVSERLSVEPVTVPLAELLMTKLQIVKLNAKDRNDVYALLLTHDVADHDAESVNARRIAELCARDWGLYRTVEISLDRLRDGLAEIEVSEGQREVIAERLARLRAAIEAEPKSARWKMRARVGDRVRWYEDPEEVEKGGY